MNQVYLGTARLLARVAPLVLVDDTFALKGGTAINLFVRDMPRLSVDLDLVFPDYSLTREQAPGASMTPSVNPLRISGGRGFRLMRRPCRSLGRPSCWCGTAASK
jgi:hypothetical protein